MGKESSNHSQRCIAIETNEGINRGQQHLFREGDRIINEAAIKRTLRDKVMVSLYGQHKLLLLEEHKSHAQFAWWGLRNRDLTHGAHDRTI